MTLPASGAISFNNINVELCRAGGAQLSLNDSCVRTLFGQASGAVCMNTGHGKTNTSTPGIPTSVSASATSSSAISVSFSAPACTGHLTIDSYQVVCTSSGSNSATGASSPISVTGLSAGTSYTFKVRAHNSKGYGCYSSTASATTQSPPYMCITTVGATVYTCCSYFTCGNVKTAVWLGSGSFTVNSLGTTSGYGNRVGALFAGGGGGGSSFNAGGGGNIDGGVHPNSIAGIATGTYPSCPYNMVTTKIYTVTVGGGGSGSSSCTGGNGTNSYISCFISAGSGGGGARNIYSGHYGSTCSGCASYESSGSKTGSYVSGAGGGGVGGVGSHGPAGGYGGGGMGGSSYSPSAGYTPRLSKGFGGGGGGGYYNYHWNSCNGVGYGVAGMDAGIGGISINNSVTRSPGSATTNSSGGGGGAAGGTGGSGGSGFVVLKWRYK